MDDLPDKDLPQYDSRCFVCMKTCRDGDAICHFKFEKRWVTLCCPLCMAAFKAEPQGYLSRQFGKKLDPPSGASL